MNGDLKICIVIVHYNTPKDVSEFIASFQRVDRTHLFKILLVDNQSTQENFFQLKSFTDDFDFVELIQAEKNGGFGYGVNVGFDYIKSKYLTDFILHIVNSDCKIENPQYLNEVWETWSSLKVPGLVGTKVLSDQLGKVQNTIMPFTSLKSILNFKGQYSYLNRSAHADQATAVEVINGVCFFVSSRAYEKVGGFDEAYFMYNEEHDLCYKLHQKGYRNYFLPIVSVIHFGDYSGTEEALDWRFLYKRRNQLLFLKKHRSFFSALVVFCLFFLSSFPKFMRSRNKSITLKQYHSALFKILIP